MTNAGAAIHLSRSGLLIGEKVVVKYASAHDLRRSFGARWASRVSAYTGSAPQVDASP
jgi:hypothetical protein